MPKLDYFEKGQLTDVAYLILVALTEPRHGYSIMGEIRALTGDTVSIGPASLYTTLKKLADAAFIRLVGEEKKKTYLLTEKGLDALLEEIEKRKCLAGYGERALQQMKEAEHGAL